MGMITTRERLLTLLRAWTTCDSSTICAKCAVPGDGMAHCMDEARALIALLEGGEAVTP